MKKQIISLSLVIVGFLAGATAISAIAAWSEPGCTPPDCNVDAPINVGTSTQSKAGNLVINSGWGPVASPSRWPTGLTVFGKSIFNGNVEIATSSPEYGKVLMAKDTSGTVYWVATSSLGIVGGSTISGGMAFGVWNDRTGDGVADTVSNSTSYLASTDGIVVVDVTKDSASTAWVYLSGYTDSSSNPTTRVSNGDGNTAFPMTFPVKKGDYWKVVGQTAGGITFKVRWLPIIPSNAAASAGTSLYDFIEGANVTITKNVVGNTTNVTIGATGGSSGGVTSVTGGSGITVSPTTGAVVVSPDYTQIQKRVSGTCASGAIKSISQTGTVTCVTIDTPKCYWGSSTNFYSPGAICTSATSFTCPSTGSVSLPTAQCQIDGTWATYSSGYTYPGCPATCR